MSGPFSDMLELHARQQLARGDVSGAIESLRRVLSEAPDEPFAHALLAMALLQARRRHAARAEARAALRLAPDLVGAYLAMGYVCLAFREHRSAGDAFRRATHLAPDEAEAHLGLGRLEAAAGRREAARVAFERARALAPDDPDPLVELGELELEAHRIAAARAHALEALGAFPEHEGALVLMGSILLAKGRIEEARAHALLVLRQDATSRRAIHLLCAAKARRSWFLGIWWRWNAFMSSLGGGRAVTVLVALFVAQRLAIVALGDAGLPRAASAAQLAWFGFAVYTWIGPAVFFRTLKKELETVRIRADY